MDAAGDDGRDDQDPRADREGEGTELGRGRLFHGDQRVFVIVGGHAGRVKERERRVLRRERACLLSDA